MPQSAHTSVGEGLVAARTSSRRRRRAPAGRLAPAGGAGTSWGIDSFPLDRSRAAQASRPRSGETDRADPPAGPPVSVSPRTSRGNVMSDASHVGGRAPETASARRHWRTGSRSRCRWWSTLIVVLDRCHHLVTRRRGAAREPPTSPSAPCRRGPSASGPTSPRPRPPSSSTSSRWGTRTTRRWPRPRPGLPAVLGPAGGERCSSSRATCCGSARGCRTPTCSPLCGRSRSWCWRSRSRRCCAVCGANRPLSWLAYVLVVLAPT